MKKNGHSSALLVPDTHGWRLRFAGGENQTIPTLDEAVSQVPVGTHLELALPCHSVLIERHKLPAIDRSELADMLQLQLEKTLPFPVEEVSHGFEVLGQEENESTVLSVSASHAELEQICAPLRQKGRVPERITLNALRIASACPVDEVVLALWPEQDQLVVAIVCNGRLSWAHTVGSLEPDVVVAEIPGLMISAELDSVNTAFTSIRLASECAHLEPALAEQFRQPIQPLGEAGDAKPEIDLVPSSWHHEAQRVERGERLKQNLLLAAVVYLVLVAGAFGYLAYLKNKARKLQQEFVRMEPLYRAQKSQEERWKVLSPAINPPRFGMEVLHHLVKNRSGNEALQFTAFSYTPREWTLKGESTTDVHFEFCQRLKGDKDLADFDLAYPPPQSLKDEKVSFTITGRPR